METVNFYSDGLRLIGDLYLPPGEPLAQPAMVFCGGWGGGERVRAGIFAQALAERGIVVLAFEYRGWGDEGKKSEGNNDRLFPLEHTVDARSAAAYLRQRAEVDPGRVAMMGMFNGAGVTLQAASEDLAINAVVGLFPFSNGARWMRSIRRFYEWQEYLDRLEDDRARRAVEGSVELVDPNEILIRDEFEFARHSERRNTFADRVAWKLGLDSAAAIMDFRPEDHLHRIVGRPVMLIAAERDVLMPIEEVRATFDALSEPKELVVLRGVTHSGTFEPEREAWLIERIANFVLA